MRIQKYVLFCLCICVLLCFSVSAHPGKTDSKGGHTDYATGEYHYHHGYPEHDHYDMDGDGDIDCPYNFDDRTKLDSGTSSGNKKEFTDTTKKNGNWKEWLVIPIALLSIALTYIIPTVECFLIDWLIKKLNLPILEKIGWVIKAAIIIATFAFLVKHEINT